MPWSQGIPWSLSWLRPTYYAGPEFHASSEAMQSLIRDIVQGAHARECQDILHTDVLAFGLALRDISIAICTRDSIEDSTYPRFPHFSMLHQEDFDFVAGELAGLLRWSEHPVYTGKDKKGGPKRKARVIPTPPVPGRHTRSAQK